MYQPMDLSEIIFTPLPEGVNHWTGRDGHQPVAVVSHITDDMSINSVLDWFRNPSSQVSAHVTIDRDGKYYQLVSSHDTAWANGPIDKPHLGQAPWLQEAIDHKTNPNRLTLSIEHIGLPGSGITPAQFVSSVRLQTFWCKLYCIEPDEAHLIGHYVLDSVTREYCPGPLFPWEALREAVADQLGK